MLILYSSVARGSTILTEYKDRDTQFSSDFESVVLSLLRNVPKDNGKYSYNSESDSTVFHIIVQDEFIYLCLTRETFPRSTAYTFLNEIRSKFQPEHFRKRALTAGPYGMRHMFDHILDSSTIHYNTMHENETTDNIVDIAEKADEVKDIMIDNAGKVLERGECLDALLLRADGIKQDSLMFRKVSHHVQRRECHRNYRLYIYGGLILFIVVAVVIIVVVIVR